MESARRRLLVAALLAPFAASAGAQQDAVANGVFLVAKPELPDPNFRETVVLITQPDVGNGPLGVILNRPLAARLSDAFEGKIAIPAESEQIYSGGPVARNRMLFLLRATSALPRSLRILDDLFLSGDPQLPARVAAGELKVAAYRAYIGYAGWGPRQLQAEIAAGGWYLAPADTDTIFAADAATVWPAMIKRATSLTT
jgi:putative transcriptional regulator